MATDAGVREIAVATVVRTDPLVLDVVSRRIEDKSRLVLLYVNDDACVEHPIVDVTPQKGSFKFAGLSIGPLSFIGDDDSPGRFVWAPANTPSVSVGDRLIVADFTWFSTNKNNRFVNVDRPKTDEVSAPKATCVPDSYADDPDGHQYCCRPHEDAEADWSDHLAERRARGELNPEVWPPVVDGDAFEVAPAGAPIGDATTAPATAPPDDVTMDDLE
jgi:hypothetical protein